MRSAAARDFRLLALLAIAGALPTILAHGNDEGAMDMGAMGMDVVVEETKTVRDDYAPTYFAHPEHVTGIYAHIALMCLAWIVMLPIAVMLSIARSRYTLALQFLFLLTNAIGVFVGINYNANTPDLYPNNAHHKLGWIVTWIVSAQVFIGLAGRVAGAVRKSPVESNSQEEEQAFIPISTEAIAEHHRVDRPSFSSPYRPSNDSGHGTEQNAESFRSNSMSTIVGSPMEPDDRRAHYHDEDEENTMFKVFKRAESWSSLRPQSVLAKMAGKIPGGAWRIIMLFYNVVDRIILILGYVALCTGLITFGRFFEGHEIFSGLAHWIKGGIFVWLGILTLGRWSGSFGELGWAWNVRPKKTTQKWRPSAEFVEGALIFTYGATNIFLENLGNIEHIVSAEDLEHMSITVLFIGGGLLAMLVESTRIRELLNTTTTDATLLSPEYSYSEEERAALEAPETYEFSINPIPALVILLLGIMMSSHTQETMISSMIHKQWGNLLTGASFARGLTYVLLYLKPPRSVLPSRPPTELLASFGLISGGTIFMASSSDTVNNMIRYNLDAMFFYTVTMGMVGLLMAWIVLVLALKGWAVRKEFKLNRSARSLRSNN